jgi:hypothetical protein
VDLNLIRQQLAQLLAADAAGQGGGSFDVFTPLLSKSLTAGYLAEAPDAVAVSPDQPDSDQPDPDQPDPA